MGVRMPWLWTICLKIRSIAAPWSKWKHQMRKRSMPFWSITQQDVAIVANYDVHTFVIPTARTSTERPPWTTSTAALEIGPVQRCCNMSLAWSLPNSTSEIAIKENNLKWLLNKIKGKSYIFFAKYCKYCSVPLHINPYSFTSMCTCTHTHMGA